MEIKTIKKIRFEDLTEFLNKNFYKIITIEILLNEKKILIKLEENSKKEYFGCEFKGKSVKDVYVMIYNFSMEKLQNVEKFRECIDKAEKIYISLTKT